MPRNLFDGVQDYRGTLERARAKFFREAADRKLRAICPCCDRFGKIYRRVLNSSMAYSVIWLYKCAHGWSGTDRLDDQGYVYLPNSVDERIKTTRQTGHLQHWGMVEHRAQEDDPVRKETGRYRITAKGEELKFSTERAREMDAGAPYIRDQVDSFVAKRVNFT